MTRSIRLVRPIVVAASLTATTSCANLFKLTPEEGAAPRPAPPRATPAPAATPATVAPVVPPPIPTRIDSAPPIPEPAPVASDSATTMRLVRAAMLWQTIGRFHPAVAARRAEWDAAFVRALPAIRAAASREALIASLRGMLAELSDPLTRVETIDGARAPIAGDTAAYARRDDGTGIVTIPAGVSGGPIRRALRRAIQDAPQAIVIDLRALEASRAPYATAAAMEALEDAIVESGFVGAMLTSPLALPSIRSRRIGEPPSRAPTLSFETLVASAAAADDGTETGVDVNGAAGAAIRGRSGWIVAQTSPITPRAADTPTSMRSAGMAVLVDRNATLPPSLSALVSSGRAGLAWDPSPGSGAVASPAAIEVMTAPTVVLPIERGVAVRVRVGEASWGDGTSVRLSVDTIGGPDAMAAAIAVAKRDRPRRSPAGGGAGSASANAQSRDRPPLTGHVGDIMEEVPYPSMGARLLGAFRIWSTMRYDHVGRDAYDDDIDDELVRAIGAVEAAQNRTQYAAALRAFVAHLDDSEARLEGASRETSLGEAAIPARVRFVDGRAIVTAVEPNAGGIAVGTEITSIDGYPVVAWLAERRALLPFSNDWTMYRDLADVFGRGPEGTVAVRVRDATGPERSLTLARRVESLAARRSAARSSAPASVIAAGIGYVDAERASPAMIDSMMSRAGDLRGVIVDLRSRAVPAAASLLTAMASRPQFTVARIVRRAVSVPCTSETLREATAQCSDERITIPLMESVAAPSAFRGRIVLLIDERTQGPAERLALALDAAASVTFVGATSAGAADETVPLPLPGRLTLSVATEEWRRSDGAPLHRVGITPLIDAPVTTRGIRAGRDEPLDRAVQWLMTQLETPVRRRR